MVFLPQANLLGVRLRPCFLFSSSGRMWARAYMGLILIGLCSTNDSDQQALPCCPCSHQHTEGALINRQPRIQQACGFSARFSGKPESVLPPLPPPIATVPAVTSSILLYSVVA